MRCRASVTLVLILLTCPVAACSPAAARPPLEAVVVAIEPPAAALPEPADDAMRRRAPPRPTAANLAGSVWEIGCEACGTSLQVHYVELRSDGMMGYNEEAPHSFIYDGSDRWEIEGTELRLRWSNDFSINVYDLSTAGPDGVVVGTKSGVEGPVTVKRLR